MILRFLLLAVPASMLPLALAAQQEAGDSAWNEGRFEDARVAYEQVLATDPAAARANLRLGILLSWREEHDSALVHIARARAALPDDAEALLTEARVMAWDRRFPGALARYDTLLSREPGFREAELGRARVLAWSGRLGPAAEAYRAVLRADPGNVDALVGLGYVYHWQGRYGPADRQARAALAADPSHGDARALRQAVRGATRAAFEAGVSWSNDSDRNTTWGQTLTVSAPLSAAVRVFAGAAALEASDPSLEADRIGGEAGLTWSIGRVQLTGAAGLRRLYPDVAPSRTSETYRARVGYRPGRAFGVSAGYARHAFDEIAGLIERGLDLETLEAGFDATLAPGLSFHGGAGETWISDGNERRSFSAGISQRIRRRFFAGAYGRRLSHPRRGLGYFSPDEFTLLEGIAGYDFDGGAWDGRVSGGLGAQQIGTRGEAQSEWHLEGRLGRRWGAGNRLELFGLVTNSAVSSTSGAFRYRSAGVTLRLGL